MDSMYDIAYKMQAGAFASFRCHVCQMSQVASFLKMLTTFISPQHGFKLEDTTAHVYCVLSRECRPSFEGGPGRKGDASREQAREGRGNRLNKESGQIETRDCRQEGTRKTANFNLPNVILLKSSHLSIMQNILTVTND